MWGRFPLTLTHAKEGLAQAGRSIRLGYRWPKATTPPINDTWWLLCPGWISNHNGANEAPETAGRQLTSAACCTWGATRSRDPYGYDRQSLQEQPPASPINKGRQGALSQVSQALSFSLSPTLSSTVYQSLVDLTIRGSPLEKPLARNFLQVQPSQGSSSRTTDLGYTDLTLNPEISCNRPHDQPCQLNQRMNQWY